jgi:hypothetical protein
MMSDLSGWKGRIWDLLPPRGRSAWTTLRHYARERKYFADFSRFHASLEKTDGIFYLFFTERLLHWALKALDFVPPDVHVVLVGSNLGSKEVAWIRDHVDRPFHHIPLRIDDKTMWEFLFAVSRESFGWLDIDCFVANPRLFEEMTRLDAVVSMNCVWSFKGAGGVDVMCTHFLFVNREVLRAVQRQVRVSPCTHNYEGSNMGRGQFSFSKVPTRKQLRLLSRVLPLDTGGRPVYPSDVEERFGLRCFDTLVLYQLVAQALGYRLNKVRPLNGTPETAGYVSDELFHVNAASWYELLRGDGGIFQEHYRRMVQLNYFLLTERGDKFPPSYRLLLEKAGAELARLEISPSQVPETVHRYFAERGFARSLDEDEPWRFLRQWRRQAAEPASVKGTLETQARG